MIQRNKLLKYALLLTVSSVIGYIMFRRMYPTEKFEEETSNVIGNLKDTIDGILSRPAADNEDDQDDDDDEDDEDDEDDYAMATGSP